MYFYNETFIKCIGLVFKIAVNLPANIFQWLAGTGIFYYCSNPVIIIPYVNIITFEIIGSRNHWGYILFQTYHQLSTKTGGA